MTKEIGPNFGLTYGFQRGENDWGDDVNNNFEKLDALIHITVKGTENDAPSSVVDGDCYIVGDTPTGAFSGASTGDIAVYTEYFENESDSESTSASASASTSASESASFTFVQEWVFYTPKDGWMLVDSGDSYKQYYWDGTASNPSWVEVEAGGGGLSDVDCVLNIKSNGADDTTTASDFSKYQHSLTVNNMENDTDYPFFGQSSFANAGSNHYPSIVTDANSCFEIATNDFTILLWVYIPASGGRNYGAFGIKSTTDELCLSIAVEYSYSRIAVYLSSNGSSASTNRVSGFTFTTGDWNLIVVERSGTTFYVTVNGVKGSFTYGSDLFVNSGNMQAFIGAYSWDVSSFEWRYDLGGEKNRIAEAAMFRTALYGDDTLDAYPSPILNRWPILDPTFKVVHDKLQAEIDTVDAKDETAFLKQGTPAVTDDSSAGQDEVSIDPEDGAWFEHTCDSDTNFTITIPQTKIAHFYLQLFDAGSHVITFTTDLESASESALTDITWLGTSPPTFTINGFDVVELFVDSTGDLKGHHLS